MMAMAMMMMMIMPMSYRMISIVILKYPDHSRPHPPTTTTNISMFPPPFRQVVAQLEETRLYHRTYCLKELINATQALWCCCQPCSPGSSAPPHGADTAGAAREEIDDFWLGQEWLSRHPEALELRQDDDAQSAAETHLQSLAGHFFRHNLSGSLLLPAAQADELGSLALRDRRFLGLYLSLSCMASTVLWFLSRPAAQQFSAESEQMVQYLEQDLDLPLSGLRTFTGGCPPDSGITLGNFAEHLKSDAAYHRRRFDMSRGR